MRLNLFRRKTVATLSCIRHQQLVDLGGLSSFDAIVGCSKLFNWSAHLQLRWRIWQVCAAGVDLLVSQAQEFFVFEAKIPNLRPVMKTIRQT